MNKNRRRVPILVSVRSSEEAKLALNSGADYIDAKEPSEGALGNLPVNKIKEIISTLKVENFSGKVTATYGDSFEEKIDFNSNNFYSYFFLGLDAVKVGFDARGSANSEKAFLELVDLCGEFFLKYKKNKSGRGVTQIIPVLMVDKGLNIDFVEFVINSNISKNLFGIMIDTKYKIKNNLFDVINLSTIKKLFNKLDSYSLPYGVAGSLSKSNSEIIKQLKPFWAGYRGGVCNGDRKGALSAIKIKSIIKSLEIL